MSTTRSPAPPEPATDAAAIAAGGGRKARWGEAALVMIAHGARRTRNTALLLERHAERLRARRLFAEVVVCFVREGPSPASMLAGLATPDVYVLPMLMSDGWVYQEKIVRELGLAAPETLRACAGAPDGRQRLLLCRPIGMRPELPALIDRRILDLCRALDLAAGDVSVLLVGHGTMRHHGSRAATERCRAALADGGRYAAVNVAFLDEDPSPREALRSSPTPHTIAVGFFVADGPHGAEDVPALLGVTERRELGTDGIRVETDAAGTVFYAGAIGTEEAMADLILRCVAEVDDRVRPDAA